MSYWLREIAGWVLVVIGLYVFLQAYGLLVNKRVFEAGPTVVIGFVVFRGGIHLLKVAVAAQAARKLPLAAALSAMVPDLDAIGHLMGVSYESFWGHRGFTHSITFAVAWGALLAVAFFRKAPWAAWVLITLGTVSHPLFDMLTNGGLGCALFAPFNNARLFFPWRPIKVAPIGVGAFFTERG